MTKRYSANKKCYKNVYAYYYVTSNAPTKGSRIMTHIMTVCNSDLQYTENWGVALTPTSNWARKQSSG